MSGFTFPHFHEKAKTTVCGKLQNNLFKHGLELHCVPHTLLKSKNVSLCGTHMMTFN